MPSRTRTHDGTTDSALTTSSGTVLPIFGCLNAAEAPIIEPSDDAFSLGHVRSWHGVNHPQARFIKDLLPGRREADRLSEAELRSIASARAAHLNAFMGDQGFPGIQLQDFGPKEFGMASVLRVGVKWAQAGTPDEIETQWGTVPAALMSAGVRFHHSLGYEHPVASFACENGDTVHISQCDEPLQGMDLVARARDLLVNLSPIEDFGAVLFPMVDYSGSVDISWLLGMWATDEHGARATITQALQQTRFQMNHLGARTQSGVAMAVTRGGPPTLRIDKPFLVCHMRPEMRLPIVAVRCCPDVWKDPGQF